MPPILAEHREVVGVDLHHYDVFLDPDLARTVLPFLDGKSKSHSWAAQAEQAT